MTKILRYDAKRDENEPDIVEALEAVGAKVLRLDDVDLIVGFRDRLYMLEVKTPKGRLNKKQQRFFREWAGYVYIIRSVDDALKRIGAI